MCQCALLEDARMMVALNPANRAYRKVTPLNDAVIDVESIVENALPGQIGLPPGNYKIENQKFWVIEKVLIVLNKNSSYLFLKIKSF